MPMGLCNAPATFQRVIDKIITSDLKPYVSAYLDDIIIVTPTYDKHLKVLEETLRRIREAGFTLNFEKSHFCQPQARFLGLLLDKDGLRPDPEKIEPILNYPTPRTVKQVRRFNGMINWYHRHLKNIASVAGPLNRLTRKNVKWQWTEVEEDSFQALKKALAEAPVLHTPDYNLLFVLYTDASQSGLGAVLVQRAEDRELLISCASKSLTVAERNYSTTEKECLAVIWAVRKFRPYLEGYHFKVITDHSSLRWLMNTRDPSGKLARWALELSGYDMEVEYRRGSENEAPDALSRLHEDAEFDYSEIGALGEETSDEWYDEKCRILCADPQAIPDYKYEYGNLYRRRRNVLMEVLADEDELWKLVVHQNDRHNVMYQVHDDPQAGHLGLQKSYDRARARYYWPGMYRDLREYISECPQCLKSKPIQQKPAGEMTCRAPMEPWEVVAADTMSFTRSKSGFLYLLIFEDLYTRWIECVPIRAANGKTVARHLLQVIINRWGAPKVFWTDNGREYINKDVEAVMAECGIQHTTTPPYHAQANPVERVNRNIKTMIMTYLGDDHREWDRYIYEFQFAYNTARHDSLGVSPAYLNFGRDPCPMHHCGFKADGTIQIDEPTEVTAWIQRMDKLIELQDIVNMNIRRASERQAKYYNLKRRVCKLYVGDQVYRPNKVLSKKGDQVVGKLAPRFVGPLLVKSVISPVIVELTTMDGKPLGRSHIKSLKLFKRTEVADA